MISNATFVNGRVGAYFDVRMGTMWELKKINQIQFFYEAPKIRLKKNIYHSL
jgi:hypothetical protein